MAGGGPCLTMATFHPRLKFLKSSLDVSYHFASFQWKTDLWFDFLMTLYFWVFAYFWLCCGACLYSMWVGAAWTSRCRDFPWALRLQQLQVWAQRLWLPGSRAQQLRCGCLVALWHVGSSWIRDLARISCVGKLILYHWATREAPEWHGKFPH